ncbi:MAG: HEAT repeat domain-containing protein [Phycisphaerae bacterium]
MTPFDLDEVYEATEACLALVRDPAPEATSRLLALLEHAAWQVRYAAAVALGDRADPRSVPGLIRLLEQEDTQPLYTQKEDLAGAPAGASMAMTCSYPPEVSSVTLDCWRRRGRVKQAGCWALAALGPAARPAVTLLARYVTDSREDYMVRAAAGRALGLIGDPNAVAALQQAAGDEEWCTRTEAQKALRRLGR